MRSSRSLLVVACIVLGCALGPMQACAFGPHRVIPDASPSPEPILAGDVTGIVEGCGGQPIVGYTFCRMMEGDAASQMIDFIGPPAQCAGSQPCDYIKVFDQAGQVAWGGSIPKGQTRVSIPWSALLGSGQFQALHRGLWSWVLEVNWVDPDGHNRLSSAQGEIRLVVYQKSYTPLDRVSADPNFVWSWSDNGRLYRMTSSLRAYVGTAP